MQKGLEPIVAMVMLVVLVVGMAGMIFTWTKSFTVNTQDRAMRNTQSTARCSGASVIIREVYLANGTNASARAVVENNGYVDNLTIDFAQIYNNNGLNYSATNVPLNFSRGAIAIILFSNAAIPRCSNFSFVSITTDCGTGSDFKGTPKCV